MGKKRSLRQGILVAALAGAPHATNAAAATRTIPHPSLAADFSGLLLLVACGLLVYTWRLRLHLRHSQAELARAAGQWTKAMDVMPDPMYLVDLDDRLVRANRAFYDQIGRRPEQAIGHDVRTLVHLKPESTPCPVCAARQAQRDGFFIKEADDPSNPTGRPLEINIRVIRDDAGKPIGIVQSLRDMSHVRNAERALRQEKDRAQITLESIGDAVISTDRHGFVDDLNPAALHLLDKDPQEVHGRHYTKVLHLIDERQERPLDDPIGRCLSRRESVVHEENALLLRGDDEVAVQLTAATMLDQHGELLGAVVVLRDTTEVRGMARQLSYQATHDALTGLINRVEFEVRLQQALESARVDDKEHALIYLDLDQFKVVNDTCGHLAGDELLTQVSALLTVGVRNIDTLARLGGDEFAILLEGCSMQSAARIADDLRQQLKELRFAWEDKLFEVGASFGLVPVSANSGSRIDVLRAADSACYVAKDRGRNRIHAFVPGDRELARHRGEMHWVHRITQALDEDRFVLYCQPILPLGDRKGAFRRFEILVRMLDEDGELVLPTAFIPAAERFQLMPAIDRWVIHRAFAALKTVHQQTKLDHFSCAINLSGQSLSDESMLDDIIAALKTAGVPPRCMCFEITETAAIANLADAKRFFSELKGLGARFALDDFGSGLSSFGYLKNLPIDYLKIDGGFVRDIVADPLDHAMVSAINEIGHLMGIVTIAEFVESQAIQDELRAIGVDFAQGFHIGHPKPLADLGCLPTTSTGELEAGASHAD